MNGYLKVRSVSAKELDADLIAAWEKLLPENPELTSPFFAPRYVQAVASVVPEIYVGIAESAGIPIAFLPFRKDRLGIGKRLPLADYQGLITRQGLILDPREFLAGCKLRAWDFDHLIATQAPFQPFHRSVSESPVVKVLDGFEAYLSERRRAGRTELIKRCGTKLRKLEREMGAIRLEIHCEEDAILRQLLMWQASRYKSRHSLDDISRILRRLLRENTPQLKGMLSVLYAGQHIAALHFGLRSAATWHWWFPTYNPAFEKYSAGLLLLLKMIEAARQLGVTMIDLGAGAMDYKTQLMNSSIPIAQGSVTVSPLLSVFRGGISRSKEWLRNQPAIFPAAQAVVRCARRVIGHH